MGRPPKAHKGSVGALKRTGMTANPEKCTWGAHTLTYLGHSVGWGLVKVPEARIAAIKNYKQPVTKRDLRAFLGSCQRH